MQISSTKEEYRIMKKRVCLAAIVLMLMVALMPGFVSAAAETASRIVFGIPATGDETNMGLLLVIAGGSVLLIAVLLVLMRVLKKKDSKEETSDEKEPAKKTKSKKKRPKKRPKK